MTKRMPGSRWTRQSLSELIEGQLSSPDARGELVQLATRLILEEALEAESRDAIGREYCENGAAPGQRYCNCVRTGRLKTAEGSIEYSAPQVAGREAPFRSRIRSDLKGGQEATLKFANTIARRPSAASNRSISLNEDRSDSCSIGLQM